MDKKINLFMEKLKQIRDFDSVKFVILYGSYSKNKQSKLSDIDFVVYYEGDKKQRFKFRLKLLGKLPEDFDVQIFQDLPLFVRIETLKGRLIYSKDLTFVYDTAYETIKSFEGFKKYYYDYIDRRPLVISKKQWANTH